MMLSKIINMFMAVICLIIWLLFIFNIVPSFLLSFFIGYVCTMLFLKEIKD